MHHWLSIELFLGTLLVTTFTCIAILALWAATSRRHWFLRTTVSFSVLSPLLLVPAFGPLLTFCLTIGLVALAFGVVRRRQNLTSDKGMPGKTPATQTWQFSIKSALAACTCIAVVFAILANAPIQTRSAWPLIALSALVAACSTLVAAWVVNGKASPRTRIIIAAMFLAVFLCGSILCEGYFHSPIPLVDDPLTESFSVYEENEAALLLATIAFTFLATVVTLLIGVNAFPNVQQAHAERENFTARKAAAAVWSFLVLAPPAFSLGFLLTPLDEPDTTLPLPNGYDQLVVIGKQLDGSVIENEYWNDPVDKEKLFAAVPRYQANFDALRPALNVPFRVPVQYDLAKDINTDSLMALRRLARHLDVKGEAALTAKNIRESIDCSSQILQLAESLHQSGLLIHTMMSAAVEDTALRGIYRSLGSMDAAQCKAAIRELSEHDNRRASWDDAIHREKVWIRNTQGWPGAIGYEIQSLSNNDGLWGAFAATRGPHPQVQALCHLVIAELAIRAYRLDNGRPPSSPSDLIPKYLATFPTDPFDPDNDSLCSAFTNGELKVWSIGDDRDDDGGKRLPRDADNYIESSGDGDLWLADFYDTDANEVVPNDNPQGQSD